MRGSGQITKHDIARCVNRAKPGSEDIMNALGDHIAEKSVLLFDGLSSYNHLGRKAAKSFLWLDMNPTTRSIT